MFFRGGGFCLLFFVLNVIFCLSGSSNKALLQHQHSTQLYCISAGVVIQHCQSDQQPVRASCSHIAEGQRNRNTIMTWRRLIISGPTLTATPPGVIHNSSAVCMCVLAGCLALTAGRSLYRVCRANDSKVRCQATQVPSTEQQQQMGRKKKTHTLRENVNLLQDFWFVKGLK